VCNMYVGAADEDHTHVKGVYVGSVMVNPVAGTYTAHACDTASLHEIQVDISQSSYGFGFETRGTRIVSIAGAYPIPGDETSLVLQEVAPSWSVRNPTE
jgi:hypothetical protein